MVFSNSPEPMAALPSTIATCWSVWNALLTFSSSLALSG